MERELLRTIQQSLIVAAFIAASALLYVFGRPVDGKSAESRADQKDKQAVSILENKWLEAINQGDVGAIDGILASDFVRPAPDYGDFVNKETLLGFYRSHLKPQTSSQKRIEHLNVALYGDTALARGTVVTRNSEGRVISKLLFTDVLVRRNGGWQAVSAQENAVTVGK